MFHEGVSKMGKSDEDLRKNSFVNEERRITETRVFRNSHSHSLNFMILCFFALSFSIAASASVHLPKSGSSFRDLLVGSSRHHRVLRSPYLPPTVIGRLPSKRANDSDDLNVIIRTSVDNLHSPIVHSQSTAGFPSESRKDSQIGEADSFDYDKVMTTYAFPRPPMVVDSSALDSPVKTGMQVNDDEEELLIRLQNDQSFINESEGDKDQGGADISKRYGKPSQKSKEKNPKRLMKFVDFSQVLNTINMTNGQLEALLKRKNIAFNDFLEFIENGASEEQILKLLESPKHPPTSVPDPKPNRKSKTQSKKFQSSDDGNAKMTFKGLTELPFTEIVHQVPFEDGKQFDINHQSNVKKSSAESKNKNKFNNKKWSRSPKTKQVPDKENYINQPWDYEAEFDYYLPPKDSPIVTHFLPSRNKNKTQISASILSVSIEEQQVSPRRESIPSEHHHFHIRNKVASAKTEVESSSLPHVSSADLKTTKEAEPTGSQYKDSQYVRQQLRLVFPMRGIVIFCGILGIIAFFTILILVIYGTLKCNDKPVTPKTYKVNEQKEIAVTAT